MVRFRSKLLRGAVVVVCVFILGSFARGSGKSALRLDLSADDSQSGGLPATFRVVMTNTSKHKVEVGDLCLTFYVGDEFYAWGRAAGSANLTLDAGMRVAQELSAASLVFDGPEGQRRLATEVASRLSRSRWSTIASVIDNSVGGSGGTAVTVWSNELRFDPLVARRTKR